MISAGTSAPRRVERTQETRARLIEAALDLFGTQGFQETTTRELAARAQVNLAAIPYHFGSKERLYAATAAHIVEEVQSHIRALPPVPVLEGPGAAKTARQMLHLMLERIAEVLSGPESERWARIVIREQMAPTAIFDILYEGFIGPAQAQLCALLATALGKDPQALDLRIQGLALFGQILVFRAARAAALKRLGVAQLGPEELGAIKRLLHFNLDAILDAGGLP